MQKRYITLAMAIFIIGLSSIAMSKEATPHQEDRYTPRQLGIPDTIDAYRVLAVLTEDNFVCMRPGEKRLVLQSLQPTIDDTLRDFPTERIKQELKELDLAKDAQWGWTIVGPGATREQVISGYDQSHRFFKAHGCITLQLPTSACPAEGGGECKREPPYP